MKYRSRKTYIIIIIILLLVLAALIFLLCTDDSIKAVRVGSKYSVAEIENQISENQERLTKIVEENESINVNPITEEDKEALAQGTKTVDQVAEELVESDDKTDVDLSKLIAKIYVMQAEYNNALENMMAQAKEEYSNFSEDQKRKTKLVKWAAGYISEATDLEHECDSKMDDILAQILALTAKSNVDSSIVDEIAEAYAEEKSLKKSWYIAQLEEKGLI